MSLAVVEANTDKPAVNNDGWKQLYSTLEQIYRIPGNMRPTNKTTNDEAHLFWKGKNVAMMINNSDAILQQIRIPAAQTSCRSPQCKPAGEWFGAVPYF